MPNTDTFMATPSAGWDNKFSTTLTSGITASDTTIPLNALPTSTEGWLVIEPDSSTAWEVIYYTSKTGSAVVCPSAAAGRGQGGSTAASHSSGATVRCDTVAEMFEALQDATALTGVHTNNSNYAFDFVASGCVWSGDAYGSTLAASMTSGVVYINGRKHTVAAVTARAFTASKDTYIDVLYSATDNVGTVVYTEVTNNAASPALAANSVRIGIIVSGAGNIAAVGSVNQGQENKVLPIASSTPYAVTDSLGNLICPRDPNRKILGYRQIVASFTTTANNVDTLITGMTVPVIVPTNRKILIKFFCRGLQMNAGAPNAGAIRLWEGTVGAGTQIADQAWYLSANGSDFQGSTIEALRTPSSASQTYNISIIQASANTKQITAGSTDPAFVSVELV